MSTRELVRSPLLLTMVMVVVAGFTAVAAAFHDPPADRSDGLSAAAATGDHTVTLRNRTDERLWTGSVSSSDGSAPLTGLPVLEPGRSATIAIPESQGAGHWRGRLFARQGCTGEDGSTFHCEVGDCGPYVHRCATGSQPVSLAEFNFDKSDAAAPWYNVSYVDAVSVPITITPSGTDPPENGGECGSVGCNVDLLAACPDDNLVRADGTGEPLVCVNPNRDAKTAYSEALTQRCSKAYSWSRHDAEPGNQVMRQCSECSGLTVTFHGTGGKPGPHNPEDAGPGGTDPGAPDPAHTDPGNKVPAPGKGVALSPAADAVDDATRALAGSGATWYHNWTSSSAVTRPEGVEYVPTIWGPGSVTGAELSQAAEGGKNLLTFNEPDNPAQSDMTPEQALDLWPRLEETGMRLGAPAVAGDGSKPGGWLDRFMQGAAERGLRVDFIPVHWYGFDFGPEATGQLADYLKRVHDRYGKPVWLTEYALTDFGQATPRYPGEAEQTAFIKSSTKMLEGLDFVKRYAWFALSTETSPTGLYDGTTPNASGRTYSGAG